jgi:hypothetical protein
MFGGVVEGSFKEVRSWVEGGVEPPNWWAYYNLCLVRLSFAHTKTMSFHFACRQPPVLQSYIEFVSALLHNRSGTYPLPQMQKVSNFPLHPLALEHRAMELGVTPCRPR